MHTDSQGTAASGNKADQIADGVSRVCVVEIYTQDHICFIWNIDIVFCLIKNIEKIATLADIMPSHGRMTSYRGILMNRFLKQKLKIYGNLLKYNNICDNV